MLAIEKKSLLLLLLAICLSVASSGWAQVANAELGGTVVDQSGAVLPSAKVTLTNIDTNVSRNASTNQFGIYDINQNPPGNYTLEITKPGFETQRISGIVLQVAQKARMDVQLKVGNVNQVVDVKGNAPLVDTETPVVGGVMESTAINQIPLNTRNFVQLTTLQPAISSSNDVYAPTTNIAWNKMASPTGGGNGAYGDSFSMDGANDRDIYGMGYNVVPPIDSIEEFKVEEGQYSAADGLAGGTVVIVATKSGTNQFHGTLWEFNRNKDLAAANFFSPTNSKGNKVQPPLVRNMFGFVFGGPIKKDRTFFFGSFEGIRDDEGVSYTTRVPTAQERTGDLSVYALPANANKTIKNPFTGVPFTNNMIPSNLLSTTSSTLIDALFPLPNNTSFLRNYVVAPVAINDQTSYSAKVDHNYSDKTRFFARWSMNNPTSFTPGTNSGGLPTVGATNLLTNWQNAVIAMTSSLTPTLVNELNLAYNRSANYDHGANVGSLVQAAQLGPPLGRTTPGYSSPPAISMSATNMDASILNIYKSDALTWDYPLRDDLTWIKGKHTFQFGGEFVRNMGGGDQDTVPSSVSFSGAFTGDGFSDLLLGIPASISVDGQPTDRADFRSNSFSAYAQDTWKIIPKLTLDLGLRYEVTTAPVEVHGNLAEWDPTLGNGSGGLLYPRQNTLVQAFYTQYRTDLAYGMLKSNTVFDTDWNNFAPRLGLAYRPFGGNRTVVRAGFGVFYAPIDRFWQVAAYADIPPNRFTGSIASNPTTPTLTWQSAYTGVISNQEIKGTTLTANASQGRQNLAPYSLQRTLSISHQFSDNTVVMAQYLGSESVKLNVSIDVQYATNGPGPGTVQSRVPFPDFGSLAGVYNAGRSNYNALLLSLERRFNHGLSYKANYTWGKSIATEDAAGANGGVTASVQDRYARESERNPTESDLPQLFSSYWVYELPFGPGKRFASKSGKVLGDIIGGWQIAGIGTARSGFPMSARGSSSACNAALSYFCFYNRTGTPAQYDEGGRGVDHPKYNRTYFPAPVFAYGNAGLFPLRDNGTWDIDAGVYRTVHLNERFNLEFRCESFNLLNYTYINVANNISPTSTTFATGSLAGPAREIQLALKLHF